MKNVTIKELKDSEIEIEGMLPYETLEQHRAHSVKELGKNIKVDGFRKGNIPEKILLNHIGEFGILEEMAQRALSKVYPEIITEHKIEAIGKPEIQITKLAKDNPLEFKIKTAVMPQITLPDYKKIAKIETDKKEEVPAVTDEEVQDVLIDLQKQKHASLLGTDKDALLPNIDDSFAKSLGDFKSLDDMKSKVKENLLSEKKHKLFEKKRLTVVEKIAEKIEISLPKILIDYEIDKMFYEMKGHVEASGIDFEEYLQHIQKTEEDMKEGWIPDAKKRVSYGMILKQIAENEKIRIAKDELEKHVDEILSKNKEASKERVTSYVEGTLMNEKVYELFGLGHKKS